MIHLTPAEKTLNQKILHQINTQHGRIRYVIAWLLGVPASLLLVVFLARGH